MGYLFLDIIFSTTTTNVNSENKHNEINGRDGEKNIKKPNEPISIHTYKASGLSSSSFNNKYYFFVLS